MKKFIVGLLTSDATLVRCVMAPIEIFSCFLSVKGWLMVLVGCYILFNFLGTYPFLAFPLTAILFLYVMGNIMLINNKHYIRFHFFRAGMSKSQLKWLMSSSGQEFNTRYGMLRAAYLGMNPGFQFSKFDPYSSNITTANGNLTEEYRESWIQHKRLGFSTFGLFAGSLMALEGASELFEQNTGSSDTFSDSAISDMYNPIVNIDGSPMVGGVDIHGNPYGITSQMDASGGMDIGGMGSMFDSSGSSSSFHDFD